MNEIFNFFKKKSIISSPRLNPKGFTLIEILVIFTVTALLGGVSFASFVSYSRGQAVDQFAANLKTAVEKGKFNAVSRVKPESGCLILNSYKFSNNGSNCTVSSVSYDYCVIAVCDDGVNNIVVSKNNLPSNITFTTSNCEIDFATLSNTVSWSGCGTFSSGAQIGVTGHGVTKTLNIDKRGNVSIN